MEKANTPAISENPLEGIANAMKGQLKTLANEVLTNVSGGRLTNIDFIPSQLTFEGIKLFEPMIAEWREKNNNNPVFDFLLSSVDSLAQNTKDQETARILGKSLQDESLSLEDVVAAQYPSEDKKVAIFKKFAVNLVDPTNIQINQGIGIKQNYIAQLIAQNRPFMREYLKTSSMVHFIPDPTVKKIKVLSPTKVTEIFERREVQNKLEFVNAQGKILTLADTAGFVVLEKDSSEAANTQKALKTHDEKKRIVESAIEIENMKNLKYWPLGEKVRDKVKNTLDKNDFYERRAYRNGQHNGIDIFAPQGSKLYAGIDGNVSAVFSDPYGNSGLIIESLDKKFKIKYVHPSRIDVAVGQRVSAEQQIGLTGGQPGTKGAGSSSTPHLHMEVYVNGLHVNPYSHLIGCADCVDSKKPANNDMKERDAPVLAKSNSTQDKIN